VIRLAKPAFCMVVNSVLCMGAHRDHDAGAIAGRDCGLVSFGDRWAVSS
jgi:hypothetical protein